jgi:hypothetical protein
MKTCKNATIKQLVIQLLGAKHPSLASSPFPLTHKNNRLKMEDN